MLRSVETNDQGRPPMLWNATELKGYAIHATDGPIGVVSDFLFDDASWTVRWLVVDTHPWLADRRILLPPLAFGHPDEGFRQFLVKLTRDEVKASPESYTDEPVSQQMESRIYSHYGWDPYWGSGYLMTGAISMPFVPPNYLSGVQEPDFGSPRPEPSGDPHLRSMKAVTGYHIEATDGAVGHVEDFLLEESTWSVHFLVVDTKNWWPGKRVLISPRSVRGIDWAENVMRLNLDREKVKDSPTPDDLAQLDRASK